MSFWTKKWDRVDCMEWSGVDLDTRYYIENCEFLVQNSSPITTVPCVCHRLWHFPFPNILLFFLLCFSSSPQIKRFPSPKDFPPFPSLRRPNICILVYLSSPCAESARAVTGRRWPNSGEGEDFLTGQLNFFTKTAVTPEWKVEKSIPRWEINGHAEG